MGLGGSEGAKELVATSLGGGVGTAPPSLLGEWEGNAEEDTEEDVEVDEGDMPAEEEALGEEVMAAAAAVVVVVAEKGNTEEDAVEERLAPCCEGVAAMDGFGGRVGARAARALAAVADEG
jgi:hypothetical protein